MDRWALEPFPVLQPEIPPRPYRFYEALMQGYDGESVEELLPLREAIVDAFDILSDYEAYVIDATHYRGLSVRAIGKELGRSKSSVFRARQRGFTKLANALKNDPAVRGYLNGR